MYILWGLFPFHIIMLLHVFDILFMLLFNFFILRVYLLAMNMFVFCRIKYFILSLIWLCYQQVI